MKMFSTLFTSAEELEQYCDTCGIVDSSLLMIQVLTGTVEIDFIKNIQLLLNKHFPNATIIGATTNDSIMDGHVIGDEQTLIVFNQFENSTLCSHILKHESDDHFSTGNLLAKKIVTKDTKVIITFTDGLKTNGDNYLKGLNSISSDVVISGGMAGDNTRLIETYVFDSNEIVNYGAVAVSITNPDLIVNTNYSFNWIPIGKKMRVTKSIRNHVYEIDNQPAYNVYAKYLGKGVNPNIISSGMGFPLIFEKNGVLIGRAILDIQDDGTCVYAGNVDEGTEVRFGIGSKELILRDSVESANYFIDKPIESIFIYNCCGRHGFLGKEIEAELMPLARIAPTAGFFTNGEFFYRENKTQFLNQTLTILGLSESKKTIDIQSFHDSTSKETISTNNENLLTLAHLANTVTGELEDVNSNLEKLVDEKTMQILEQIYNDSLTKLPNRLQFLADIQGEGSNYIILINIDDFTSINDYFGYSLGDNVLIKFSKALQEYLKGSNAKIYKLPSDEYAIVCEKEVSVETLESYIKSLLEYTKNVTFEYKDKKIHIPFTIGAALVEDATQGVRNADIALKHAKKEKIPYIIYDKNTQMRDTMKKNIEMANLVRTAINKGKVVPYYQPIFNLTTNEIYSHEALARIIGEDGSIIAPNHFIPAAHKIRMYSHITHIIFEQILLDINKYSMNISINLAIEDILESQTKDYLLTHLSKNGVAPYITFEILETQELENDEIVQKFIKEVQNLGARVAIDDFGSGFANFQYMTRIQANIIKIDGSLIRIIEHDKNARLVVEAIVSFANKMGMKTVAEFIHSAEVLYVVKEIGIDYGQGFYLAEPAPIPFK